MWKGESGRTGKRPTAATFRMLACTASTPHASRRVRPGQVTSATTASSSWITTFASGAAPASRCARTAHATINASEAYYFDAEEAAPYETEGLQRVNVAEKCIFCYPRIDQGLEPACVHNCPGGARFFGDVEDPESAISQKIAQEGDAVHNLSGTSFYYVPFSTMPADLLPMPGFYKNESADAGKGEGEQAEGAADASPLMVAGGVAAVAVVGAGVGVAVKRSRSKRPAGPDASQVETEMQREEGSADHE